MSYTDCYTHICPHNAGAGGTDNIAGDVAAFYTDNRGLGLTGGHANALNVPISGDSTTGDILECRRTMMWEPYVTRVVCGLDHHRFQTIHEQDAGGAPVLSDTPDHIRRGREINIMNYSAHFRARLIESSTEDTLGDWIGDGARDRPASTQYLRVILVEVYDMGGGDTIDNVADRRTPSTAAAPMLTDILQHSQYKWHTTEAMGEDYSTSMAGLHVRPPKYRFHAPMAQDILRDMPPEDVNLLTTHASALSTTDELVLQRRYLRRHEEKNGTVHRGTVNAEQNDPAGYEEDIGTESQYASRSRRFRVLYDKAFAFQTHAGRDGTRQVDIKFSRPLGKVRCTKAPSSINGCGRRYFWYFMPSISTHVNGAPVVAAQGQHHFKVARINEKITYRDSAA